IFPGGFGAAKNLCTFAMGGEKGGANCEVLPDVTRVLKAFHTAKKPIGLCCIAPVLAARVLGTRQGGPGVKVTSGTDSDTARAIPSYTRSRSAPGTAATTNATGLQAPPSFLCT